MDEPYYVNFTGASDDILFQRYCLIPPSDSCDYGPCPNPDVTGIGQQVSLYITSTVFAITMIYNPEDFNIASYSYMANIYSLLISALISMLKVQLTQNDAIFVLVATVSPATIYVWWLAGFALYRGLPMRISRWMVNKHEQNLFIVLSCISFALWVIMLGLIIGPSSRVAFSQPDCNKSFGTTQFIVLLWSSTLIGKSFIAGGSILGIAIYLKRRARTQMGPQSEQPNVNAHLIAWTRKALEADFKSLATPHRVALVLVMMQIPTNGYFFAIIPPRNLNFTESIARVQQIAVGTISALLAMLLIMVDRRPSQSMRPALVRMLFTGLVSLITLAYVVSPLPLSALDFVNTVCWCTIWCKGVEKYFGGLSRAKILFRRSGFVALVLFTQISPVLPIVDFYIFPQLWWFCAWEIFSFIPAASIQEDVHALWSKIMDSAQLFKFMYLIVGPTALWCQATESANPTKLTPMTFGQIFAVIIAAVSLWSLGTAVYKNHRAIKNAVWMLEVAVDDSASIPMHVHQPPAPHVPNAPPLPVKDPVPCTASS